MSFTKNAVVVALTGSSYYLLFLLNDALFSSLSHAEGVSWVFLPSGLRLAFVLVFVEFGAVGIALGSIAIGFGLGAKDDLIFTVVTGLISGFAPWLARLICIDRFRLEVNLDNLSPTTLLQVALVFACVSPVLHQLWFSFSGRTDHFLQDTLIMAVGDLLGTLVMLFLARFVLNLLPDLARR